MIIGVLLMLPVALLNGALMLIGGGIGVISDRIAGHRDRKRARIELELDRTQAQLRATMLELASELGADAHEARKAMIRQSFIESGRAPNEHE